MKQNASLELEEQNEEKHVKGFQVQVELYCHSATCVDIQWDEMSCLTVLH